MFGQQSANKPTGLSINTGGSSLFGGNTASQPSSTSTPNLFGGNNATSTTGSSGGLFGGASKPAGSSLFGGAATSTPSTTQTSSTPSLFGGNTNTQEQKPANPLFGGATSNTSAPSTGTGGLFGGTSSTPASTSTGTPSLFGSTTNNTSSTGGSSLFGGGAQTGSTGTGGSSLFGGNTNTQQSSTGTPSLFGGAQNKPAGTGLFGSSTTNTGAGGLFGQQNQQQQQQQPQQQQQGPTLSLFGSKPAGQTTQQPANASNTVQGVKIDITNLVPTTKFEACSTELQNEIEKIDNMIQNQIKMCNEVSDLLPSIVSQGSPVPTDVEFVENKLETLQEALELDAAGIENSRQVVERDAAEAKLAFRTIDTLLLPLQYQPTPGERWWSSTTNSSGAMPRHSLRSALGARHTLLALPKDAEEDVNEKADDSMPANLVEFFSRRADGMSGVVGTYRGRLSEIEAHLRELEGELTLQLHDAVAKSRGNNDAAAMGYTPAQGQVAELAGALEDIEGAILTVAGRVGDVKDQVSEASLGPIGAALW
ncbi:hypothetical protein KEM55_002650 [Ascosphaera atra]|nr:hypothetical protein KEM55_002650 [Ascosphaera atra]